MSNYSSKLDEITRKLASIDKTLAVNTEQLKVHVKRTDLLESKVESLDQDVTKLRGFFTIAGWVIGIAATILTVTFEIYGRLAK